MLSRVFSWRRALPWCSGGGHAPRQLLLLRQDSHSSRQPQASACLPPSLLLPSPEGPHIPQALTQLKCILINVVQTRGVCACTGERVHSASAWFSAWEIRWERRQPLRWERDCSPRCLYNIENILARCSQALRSSLLVFKHRLCKRCSSERVGGTGAFMSLL